MRSGIPEPRQMGNSFGFTAWRGPSAAMSAPHAHNDIEVNFCASELTYDSAGRISTLPAGVPCAFWGAKPHQLVGIDEERPLAFVTIPLARFASWGMPDEVRNRLLQGEVLTADRSDDHSMLASAFDRWMLDLHSRSELRIRAAELEVEALLLRMAFGDWAARRAEPAGASAAIRRAAAMATFISENAHDDIRVADVARTVHLHPNRAAATFKAVLGTSITGYLAQFRIAEAQRLLLTTDLGSAEIAERAGFQSLSSYHQLFASVCGTSPGRWRRQQLQSRTADEGRVSVE